MAAAIPFAIAMVAGAVIAASMQPGVQSSDYATQLNTQGTQNDVPVIYGQSMTGAHRVFDEIVNSGNSNDMATFIYIFGEGEIHAFNQIYIDDVPLFNRELDYKNGTIGQDAISGDFSNHVQVQLSTGSETNPFFFTMAEQNSDGRWRKTDRLNGRAAVCLKVKLDPWKGKIKSDGFKVTAKVKGKLIHDIRYQGAIAGYQSQYGVFGNNPALCVYDYLTNTRYGCGISADYLDEQSFILVANWCDKHGLTCDGVVNQKQTYKKNLDALLSSCNGFLIDTQGIISMRVDMPTAKTFDFTSDHLIGDFIRKPMAVDKYFNKLETTWFNPGKQYQQDVVCYPDSDQDPTIQADGKVITQRLELPFTKNKAALDTLSSKEVMKSKHCELVEFTANIEGFVVSVMDVVSISCPEVHINNKLYRIIELQREIQGKAAGTVKIQAVEYNQQVYTQAWTGISRDQQPVLNTVQPVRDLAARIVEAGNTLTACLEWTHQQARVREFNVFFKRHNEHQNAYRYYDTVNTKRCVITGLPSGYYDFEVVAVDVFGIASASEYVLNVDLHDDTVFPTVTGLRADASTQDFIFSWDDMQDKPVREVDNGLTVQQKTVKDYFAAYELLIKHNGVTVERVLVRENKYQYTLANNQINGVSREVQVEVRILGTAGAKSQTAAVVVASNKQNQAPQGIEVSSAPAALFVQFKAPTEPDYAGTEIHWSRERDFTPSADTLMVDLQGSCFYNKIVDSDDVWFIRLASYDYFGRDDMLFTKCYEISTKSANSVLVEISSDALSKDLLDVINGKANSADVDALGNKLTNDLNNQASKAATATKAVENKLAAATKQLQDKVNATASTAAKQAADALTAANKTANDALNKAKAELRAYTDNKQPDLKPVYAAIDASKQTLEQADAALATKINSTESKTQANAAAVQAVEQSVTDLETSTATKLESVKAESNNYAVSAANHAASEAKAFATAELTKEQAARTSADSALSKRVDQTQAAINNNTAAIKSTQTAIADVNTAMASKINALATTVSSNKADADKAVADAKVQAATDAKAKADKALADAKADATAKANTAESKAKVAAAQDASNKANKALADAKAYADVKSKASNDHTDAKFNEAIKLVNDSNTATASKITDLATTVCSNQTATDKAVAKARADAAADAAKRTTDALNAAKTDAANKSAAAQAEAIKQAQAKADAAKAAAIKAAQDYANAKATDERKHTDAKFNEAVNLVNSKDQAMASRVSTLDSAVSLRLTQIDSREANWQFTQQLLNWTQSSTIYHVTDPEEGDCMELHSSDWPSNNYLIPVDPARVYEISMRMKQHETNGNSNSYLGIICYDKDKREINTNPRGTDTKPYVGTYTYCGKAGGSTATEWTTYSGKVTGINGYSHNAFRPDTCFVKIMLIGNYSGGKGKCRVSWVDFQDVTERDQTAARISTVEKTVTDNNTAMASRVTSLQATVNSNQSVTDKAINEAKVAAAQDAANKANKALADAKADATSKANTAESNAKVQAAADAKAKADKALADAKAYANSKAAEANKHTDAKFNEAVKLANDSNTATASKVTALETTVQQNKATATTEAAKAKADATAEAQKRADAALAAAKADATNKSAAAQAEAIKQAQAKADKAKADAVTAAKAYTDAKKNEATAYTTAKFNEAVKLVNDKDQAQASKISSLEATTNSIRATGLAYRQDITVQGEANLYYPVYFKGGNQDLTRKIQISRAYYEAAPDSWNTKTHKGGLLIDISANFGGWGGQTYDWWLNECNQSYTTMYAGASHAAHCQYFCVWLRGGGAVYHLSSDQSLNVEVGYDTKKKIFDTQGDNNDVYVAAAKTRGDNTDEINGKLRGTKHYAGLSKVENLTADEIRKPVRDELTAKISEVNKTITDKNNAVANSVKTVESTVNSVKATAEQATKTAASVDGKVKSMYTLRLTADKKVAGFGLANDGATSAFSVQADKFLIYDGKADQAVFAVQDGKLVVKQALIQNLDASTITTGTLDAARIGANTITAKHITTDAIQAINAQFDVANIGDATIGFAKIQDDMQSVNFKEGATGWRLTKGGGFEANNAVFRGRMESAYIKGAFIEGGLMIGGADFTIPTQGDNGTQPRKVCHAGRSCNAVSDVGSGWGPAGRGDMASPDYVDDGIITYNQYGKVYANFNRSRTWNLTCSGNVSFKVNTANTNVSFNNALRVQLHIQVVGVKKNGQEVVLAQWHAFNYQGSSRITGSHALASGLGGSLSISTATGTYHSGGDPSNWDTLSYTYVTGVSAKITSLPAFNYQGNYRYIAVKAYAECGIAGRSACGNRASFTFKSN
ncbi:hypothetical protein [Vibrio cholerae]|uniref:phage tail tip fiber protein n=1 Tax=Vibrio cholerae TaxID=666 RepID=UPI001E4A1EE1|nr:hypothetical protein [Vibrio cholerae]MCD1217631.1 hypothetical protein [Vibrio cholerae]